MALVPHRTQTGLNAAHPPFYASESDPTTTLGPYRGWIKPSTGEVWIRNAANTAWLDVVVTGTSTALTAHLSDATDAHDASAVSIVDAGGYFTGAHVEAALQELGTGGVTEIDDLADVDTSTAPPADGQTLIWDDANSEWIPGSVAAGTVAAADVTYAGGTGMSATDAEAALDELATEKANASDLTDHISDASAAHAASAISYAGGTGMSATNAEAAIDELATEKANDAALTAHIGDTSDAHDASAISYAGGTGISATDVEAAIDELATEKTDDSALTAHIADATDAHDASAISFVPAGSIAATNVQSAIEEAASEAGGGGSAHVIQDEGTPLTQRANLSFEGAGVTVTDDSGDAQTVVTIPGGGGGSGNISGAYDIEAGTYTDAGMSDEFASGTLDAKWNTATSSGTIDFPGQPASGCYDLTSRSGTLLLQPAYSTSAEASVILRQADGLSLGESLVMSCAMPWLAKYTATVYQFIGLWMNSSTTSYATGTYNTIHVVMNSVTPAIQVRDNSAVLRLLATDVPFNGRVYLRVSRKTINSIDSFVWMFSTDGIVWHLVWQNTAQNFTQLWMQAITATQTNPSIAPVYPINWIRHVASTAHDLW